MAQELPLPDGAPLPSPSVVGLVLGRVAVSQLASPTTSTLQARMRELALQQGRRGVAQGLLEYEAVRVMRLLDPRQLASATLRAADVLHTIRECAVVEHDFSDPGKTPKPMSCFDCSRGWEENFGPLLAVASVAIASAVATRIALGHSQIFHCVVVTRKLNRKRLLTPEDMPKKRLRTLRKALPPPPSCRPGQLVERRWSGSQGARDPDLMLYLLDCSQELKQQRSTKTAAQKFARLLSAKSGIPVEVLLGDEEFASGRLMIKSRMRLDCAASLLHRQWWAGVSASDEPVSVHLFCDASPQWRGVELFATSVDIFVGGRLFRRLAPLVSVGKSQLGLNGKMAALMWQLYLLVGPSPESMQRFCDCVRSVTTDLGTERLFADSASCIVPFIAAAFPQEASPTVGGAGCLFGRCLQIPGFRHMIDNMLQKALCSLRDFPSFLDKLKSVVRFFRDEGVVDEVCQSLERAGRTGLAEVLRKSKLVSFAAWRWGTLSDACQGVAGFIFSLAAHFDPQPFRRQRDSGTLSQVTAAMRSPKWAAMFDFVHWFAGDLSRLAAWIGGCACHEEQLASGVAVACPRKGRRLAEAHSKVQAVLAGMLEEANSWTQERFRGDIAMWRECQGAVRMVVEYGLEKFAFLEKIPYLLAQLPEALVGKSPKGRQIPSDSIVRLDLACPTALVYVFGPANKIIGLDAFFFSDGAAP